MACTTCEMGRILSGEISPSSCVRINEPCTGNSYQSAGGDCMGNDKCRVRGLLHCNICS